MCRAKVFYINSPGDNEPRKIKRLPALLERRKSAFQCEALFYSNLPVIMAIFNSPMALVILISRGQASVQL
jgi:hypothetical protein